MAEVSWKNIKELLLLLKEKSLKEIFLGNKVKLNNKEEKLLQWIKKNPLSLKKAGGRKGYFIRLGLIHKGNGNVYLLPNKLGNSDQESILLFDSKVKIQSGPDLYVYLSAEQKVKDKIGKILNLGLLKGTKGGQSYVIKQNINSLDKYQSVVVYCKKFKV